MFPTTRTLPISIALLTLFVIGCGSDGSTDECTPHTCESLELECGIHDDGCGDEIDCGECPEGHDCEEGACIPSCVEPPCTPYTCEEIGARCGLHDDGCGDEIDCGPCGSCPGDPLCFIPESGAPDAVVETVPGEPPSLAGGEIEDEWYELESLHLFTENFLSSTVTSEISSNGDTFGSIEFWEDEWGLAAQLDLNIYVEMPFVDPISDDLLAPIEAGGCLETSGNRIVGDMLECGGNWLEDSEPPDSVDYEVDEGKVQLLVIIDREFFIENLPPDYQDMGSMMFTGDLPILMTFLALESGS